MSNYLPNTIDLELVKKKYGNEKDYNILQIAYRNYVESLLNTLIDFKAINKIIKDSKLEFKKINDEDYNIYHKGSNLDCDYLFIRNNIHIENLNDNEIKALIENNIYDSFITDTIGKVLDEKTDFLAYGSDPKELKFTRGLIFEFAYDGSELSEEERKQREKVIKTIDGKINENLVNSPFVTNFITYDKTNDYFRPKVKERNSILGKMKIVKTVNDIEADHKKEVVNATIENELLSRLKIKPEPKVEEPVVADMIVNKEKALTKEEIAAKLQAFKKSRVNLLVNKENDEVNEKLVEMNEKKESNKKNLIQVNSFINKLVTDKEEKPVLKEESSPVVIKLPEEIVKKELKTKDSIKNIDEYIGTIGNKKYIIRYVASFEDNGNNLNIYDYSINGNHRAYYTNININNESSTVIETLFGIDNLRTVRKNNTSYLGTIEKERLIRDKDTINVRLETKLVRRENNNIVIIESINKNNYYILNLATNKTYKVVTDTDIFSDINSNEELAKWLTDDLLEESKDKNGYIGKLGLNGIIME